MTGTSLDGIDAAVIAVTGHGLSMRAAFRSHAAGSLGAAEETLRHLATGRKVSPRAIAAAVHTLSSHTAAVMSEALGDLSADLAGVHGQTVLHAPPNSWQLMDAAIIAASLSCPVACQMRAGDLAAGGQGAPITPLADWILFRGDRRRAVVNLGGFCNITWLPASEDPADITGRDICVCNQLLDAAARERLGTPWDTDGRRASAGTPDAALADALVARLTAADHATSLGTGDESLDWLDSQAAQDAPTDVLLASLATAIGRVVGAAAATAADEILLAGGGANHEPLVDAIRMAAGKPVSTTAELGIPIEAREAACIAVLAALDHDGVPTTLPAVTGRVTSPMISMQWCRPVG